MGVKFMSKIGSPSHAQSRQGKADPPTPPCQLKITILGGQAVGKTALVSRFTEGAFQQEYVSTIVNRHHKRVSFKERSYGLDIIDPAGYQVLRQMDLVEQEAYHAVDGFMVVYSICNPDSLKVALRAYRRATTKIGRRFVPAILVGTQADVRDNALSPMSEVSSEEARKTARDEGFCHWMEVTATNCSPHSAFRILVSNIASNHDSVIWESDNFPTHYVPPSPSPSIASQFSKKSGISRFFGGFSTRSLSCPDGTSAAQSAVLSRKRRSAQSLQSVRNACTPDLGSRMPPLRPSFTHSSLFSGASMSSFYPNETPSVTPNPGMALRLGRQMRRPISMPLGSATDFFMDENSANSTSTGGSNDFLASDCPPPLPPKTVVYRDGCLVIKIDNGFPQVEDGEAIYEEVDLSRLNISSNHTGVPPAPPVPPTPPPRPKHMPPLHPQTAGSINREDSDSDSMPLSKIGSTSTDTSSSCSEISPSLTQPPTPTQDRLDTPLHSLSRTSSLYRDRQTAASKAGLKDSKAFFRPLPTAGSMYVRNTNSGEVSEEEGGLNEPGPIRRAGTFRVKPVRGGVHVKGLTATSLLGKLKAKASAWA